MDVVSVGMGVGMVQVGVGMVRVVYKLVSKW